jgi:LemA protein
MELIVIAIVLGVVLLAALLYNGLVQARLAVQEGWSAIQVQLQRRGQLIPNLVETVRGYASHERATFDEVTRARTQLLSASTPAAAAEANNALSGALRSLFAVAEAYPELKANQNFLDLQRQLGDTEDKIAYARNFYNSRVLDYNSRIATVPSVVLAGPLGFQAAEFFQGEPEALAPVKVSFAGVESPPSTTPTPPART